MRKLSVLIVSLSILYFLGVVWAVAIIGELHENIIFAHLITACVMLLAGISLGIYDIDKKEKEQNEQSNTV